MIRKHQLARRRTLALSAFIAGFLCCVGLATASADPAPPATTTGSPIATQTTTTPTAPAPTAPVAPAPAPVVAPAARREDENTPPGTPNASGGNTPPPGNGPSIFERAAAYVQGRDGLAAQIASLQGQNRDLLAQLAQRDQTITALNGELATLRAGSQKLEAALQKLEGNAQSVAQTVASLGFPAGQLPNAKREDEAGDTEEGLLAAFKAEQDPDKKATIAAKLREVQARS